MADQQPQQLSKDELAARGAANSRLAIVLGLLVAAVYTGYILYHFL